MAITEDDTILIHTESELPELCLLSLLHPPVYDQCFHLAGELILLGWRVFQSASAFPPQTAFCQPVFLPEWNTVVLLSL